MNLLNNANSCLTECPQGYYGATTARVCRICDPNCKTCVGATNTDCIVCANGKFLYYDSCISSCPIGTFLD